MTARTARTAQGRTGRRGLVAAAIAALVITACGGSSSGGDSGTADTAADDDELATLVPTTVPADTVPPSSAPAGSSDTIAVDDAGDPAYVGEVAFVGACAGVILPSFDVYDDAGAATGQLAITGDGEERSGRCFLPAAILLTNPGSTGPGLNIDLGESRRASVPEADGWVLDLTSAPEPDPSTTAVADEATTSVSTTAASGVAIAECVSGELYLGMDTRRDEIALYQTTLAALGYDPGGVDGYFGQGTLAAAYDEIMDSGTGADDDGMFVEWFPDDGAVLLPAFERLGIAC